MIFYELQPEIYDLDDGSFAKGASDSGYDHGLCTTKLYEYRPNVPFTRVYSTILVNS